MLHVNVSLIYLWMIQDWCWNEIVHWILRIVGWVWLFPAPLKYCYYHTYIDNYYYRWPELLDWNYDPHVLSIKSLLCCSQIKGSANFSLCVKDMMPLDIADHFRGSVSIWASVTSIDGSRQTTFDDSTPVHKQLIDIKYSKDTRKQFKPGLPYKGKVRR